MKPYPFQTEKGYGFKLVVKCDSNPWSDAHSASYQYEVAKSGHRFTEERRMNGVLEVNMNYSRAQN